MSLFSYLILALWANETIFGAIVGFRCLTRFPITACLLLIRSGLYAAMAVDWATMGLAHYRMGHLATAWVFRLMTVLMAMECVWLMAQGIPQVRRFAVASSLLFAGMGVLVAMATGGILRGEWVDAQLGNSVNAYRNLAVGCVVYLYLNYRLYERAKPLGTLATRHWAGMIALLGGIMLGAAMEHVGHSRTFIRWDVPGTAAVWCVYAGQYTVRVGSLAALVIWGKGETKWQSGTN